MKVPKEGKIKAKAEAMTELNLEEEETSDLTEEQKEIKRRAKLNKKKLKEEDKDKLKPTRANLAYIYFQWEKVPELKKTEGLNHPDAMFRAG